MSSMLLSEKGWSKDEALAHHRIAISEARKRANSSTDVEDLAQEGLKKFYSKYQVGISEGDQQALIRCIVRNLARDRARKKTVPTCQLVVEPASRSARELDEDLIARLRDVVKSLSDNERTLLESVYWDGSRIDDIAERQGISYVAGRRTVVATSNEAQGHSDSRIRPGGLFRHHIALQQAVDVTIAD